MKAGLMESPRTLVAEDIATPRYPGTGNLVGLKPYPTRSTDIKMNGIGNEDPIYPRIEGHEVAGTILR